MYYVRYMVFYDKIRDELCVMALGYDPAVLAWFMHNTDYYEDGTKITQDDLNNLEVLGEL